MSRLLHGNKVLRPQIAIAASRTRAQTGTHFCLRVFVRVNSGGGVSLERPPRFL